MNCNYSLINNNDFKSAVNTLNLLTQQNFLKKQEFIEIFSNYGKQSPIQTSLNILNKVAIEGSIEQKKTLSAIDVTRKIRDLNKLLNNPQAFKEKILELGFENKDAESVNGYQIALPKTRFSKLLNLFLIIPRITFVICKTLFSLAFAGIALPIDQFYDLNPKLSSKKTKNQIGKINIVNEMPYQGFEIAGVVCFNSPLRGTPALDLIFNANKIDKRYQEMTINNEWRHKLYTDSLQAERDKELNVYTYGSTLDPACYGNCHLLTENPTRNLTVSTEGHHDTMISFSAMKFLKKAIKDIDPTGTIPVIQLHGSGAGKYQFTLFRLVSGYKRTFAIDYAESRFGNHPKTSIVQYAQNNKIQSLFKQVYEVTGQKKAILVGHSMGGMVSLEIARNIRNFKVLQEN